MPHSGVPSEVEPLVALFEGLPHVIFSLKGNDGRYIAVNQAFADRAGCRTPSEVLGKRAGDLFAPELAATYETQDAVVRSSGRPVRRQLELITRPDGTLGWYVTNKVLVTTGSEGPVAIAAVSVDEHVVVHGQSMDGLEAVVAHVREHFAEPLALAELALAGNMSPATLERRMRRVLGLSPRQLLVRVRLEEAVHRIVSSEVPLGEVAAACGFFDQAAMNRQMRQLLGVTPGSMRRTAG
ncbi:MAG: helix-turn-helix domain-containing protein [Acidimicrobiales bacterium]|jgi:PAS domain S-box-containing protein